MIKHNHVNGYTWVTDKKDMQYTWSLRNAVSTNAVSTYVDFGQNARNAGNRYHTAGLDTIFVQIYMDALPGVPGVSKNQIFFYK